MLPDRVSNPGPLTYELGALPIALCGPAASFQDYCLQTECLPAKIVCMILFSEKSLQEAEPHGLSWLEAIYHT